MAATPAITVLKCGGTSGVDPCSACSAVADLVRQGGQVVLVHGGSAQAQEEASRLGLRLRQIVSADGATSRYTDAEAFGVLLTAWTARVKPVLVTELVRLGVQAVGLTGLDAGMLTARRLTAQRAVVDGREVVVRDTHTGRIASVRTGLLSTLLSAGMVPVVSPPALALDGTPVNVNSDRIAAAIAVALGAARLVLLTAAPGVLADPADERTVLSELVLPADRGGRAAVTGGMAVKLAAAQAALAGGVPEVLIADGRDRDRISGALAGPGGTRIRRCPQSAQKGEASD
jgi:acetylglutamate/LysW-gamma-L-alpha-aminoadipate kinase